MPSEVNAQVSPLGRNSEQEKKSDSDIAIQDDDTKGGRTYSSYVYMTVTIALFLSRRNVQDC